MLDTDPPPQEDAMQTSIPLDGPVDLAALDAFLASDRAPPSSMSLSELDGFLAGIVAGPEAIMPSEWLPLIWHEGEPEFADVAEASAVLGVIMRRYNEITAQLDMGPRGYQPVLVEGENGSMDASDWTLGFLQAMSMRAEAWEPLVSDRDGGAMMVPILLIASTTDKAGLQLDEDELLPEAEMAKLLAEADTLLSMTVVGIRAFFRLRRLPSRRKRTRHKRDRPSKARRR